MNKTTHLNSNNQQPIGSAFSRRRFLRSTAGSLTFIPLLGIVDAYGQANPIAPAEPDDWLYGSASEMARLIAAGEVSALEAVTRCFERIDVVNPAINAVVAQSRSRALMEAQEADALLASGADIGPLHGVPFTIKDSIMTEGLVSTAGTTGLRNHIPGKDATVVARLRAAGAILLGKTNTPEFTLGGGGRGTWNLIYGDTSNPFNVNYLPSGSSGGSGAIVAAGGSFFDIGSDFGGSIRGPAHANGVHGLKPTTGRVPRTGHLPGYGGAFDSYQQLGPICRSTADAELIYSIITGPGWEDAAIHPLPVQSSADVDLSKIRLAWYDHNGDQEASLQTKTAITRAVSLLSERVASVTKDHHGMDSEAHYLRNQLTDADGGAWLSRLVAQAGTREVSSGLSRRMSGKAVSATEFYQGMEKQDELRSRMSQWFQSYDAIICPVSAFPTQARGTSSPPMSGFTRIFNITGWPSHVIPAGLENGIPFGLQIVAHPFREDVALALSQYLEGRLFDRALPNI